MNQWRILAAILLFPVCAYADLRVDIPKFVKQGSYFRVDIEQEDSRAGAGIFLVRFCTADFCKEFKSFPITSYGRHVVLVPVVVDTKPMIATLNVFDEFEAWMGRVEIKKVNFPESKKVFYITRPDMKILARREREQVFLENIYAAVTLERYFSENLQFTNPLETLELVPNSDFGQVRKKVLINPKTKKIESRWIDYHKGVDFRASVGTPVFAAESGKVVAARNLLGSGNTVVIDHGYGLLSLYFHLSRMKIKEGVEIKRGQKIGAVGMSGNAEGPHLHFETRLYGVPVNPFEFLRG